MNKFEKQLKKGVPLSEYYELKKTYVEVQNHYVIKSVAIGGGLSTILKAIEKCFNKEVAVMCSTTTQGIENLNVAGNKILGLAQDVAFWIIAVVVAFRMIRAFVDGDKHKAFESLISGALVYGSLYFITFILNLIKDTMGGI